MIEAVWNFLIRRGGWVYLGMSTALALFVAFGRHKPGLAVIDFLVGVATFILFRWMRDVDLREVKVERPEPALVSRRPEAPPAPVIERPWDDSLERHRRQCEICNGAADKGEE